jgi:lactose/raffinose/galactose permease
LAFFTCLVVAIGTKETQSKIRSSAGHFGVTQVFKTLAKNDQLMWIGASYIFFCLAQLITQGMLLPYFTYILGNADLFSVIGVINLVVSFVAVAIFPIISKILPRKTLYIICILVMIVGLAFFLFGAGGSTVLVFVGYFFFQFPYPILFLCVMLTIADTVEYGQWKNGVRAESATLVVRVMCDKVGGAVSNGIIGLLAVFCAINSEATAATVAADPQNLFNFKILMIAIPAVFMAIAIFIYWKKVKINEKRHAEIVKELEARSESQS